MHKLSNCFGAIAVFMCVMSMMIVQVQTSQARVKVYYTPYKDCLSALDRSDGFGLRNDCGLPVDVWSCDTWYHPGAEEVVPTGTCDGALGDWAFEVVTEGDNPSLLCGPSDHNYCREPHWWLEWWGCNLGDQLDFERRKCWRFGSE